MLVPVFTAQLLFNNTTDYNVLRKNEIIRAESQLNTPFCTKLTEVRRGNDKSTGMENFNHQSDYATPYLENKVLSLFTVGRKEVIVIILCK